MEQVKLNLLDVMAGLLHYNKHSVVHDQARLSAAVGYLEKLPFTVVYFGPLENCYYAKTPFGVFIRTGGKLSFVENAVALALGLEIEKKK